MTFRRYRPCATKARNGNDQTISRRLRRGANLRFRTGTITGASTGISAIEIPRSNPNAITKKSVMRIQDSVAFITGANRGLGLAFARELLGRDAKKVYAGIRNPDAIDLPGVLPVRLDVTDPASVSAAAVRCGDVTLLVNNAGIGRVNAGALDPALIDSAREIFETNFYGMVRASQAFAPVLSANGGGGIINVLSDATWFARPMLTAYSATKSATWSFTNALRIDLREKGTQVLALHVGFLDTDMAKGLDVKKSDPQRVATRTLDAREWQRGGACR
jgi:NAD(P)-dependent dehydrogenase (short-subunit alcohol dehydrogenase family)